VSSRAAQLVAICTAQLLNRMDDEIDDIAIAFDGSVYKHSPRIKLWIEKYIRELMPRKKVNKQKLSKNINKEFHFIPYLKHMVRSFCLIMFTNPGLLNLLWNPSNKKTILCCRINSGLTIK
jgi:Hexokinase